MKQWSAGEITRVMRQRGKKFIVLEMKAAKMKQTQLEKEKKMFNMSQ